MPRLFILLIILILSTHSAIAAASEAILNKKVITGEDARSISVPDFYGCECILITTEYNSNIYLFDKNGVKLWNIQMLGGTVGDVATNGEYVVVGYSKEDSLTPKGNGSTLLIERGRVRAYFSKSKQIIFDVDVDALSLSSYPIHHIAISSDGSAIAVSDLRNFYILDISGNILRKVPRDGDITAIAIAPKFGAVAVEDTVYLFDNKGLVFQSFKIESTVVNKLSITDYGYIAILASKKIFVYQYNEKLWEKSIKNGSFSSVSISPDGNLIAVGSTIDGLFLFDKNGVEILRNPTIFKDVSTNGRLIAGLRNVPPNAYLYLFDATPYINGSISIASTQGAEVYLDDKFVGTVPTTISEVTSGNHIVRISKTGYESWTQNVDVSPGDKKEISVMLSLSVQTPNPTPVPTLISTSSPTPTSGVFMVTKSTFLFILLGIILIAIPSFVYFRRANLKHTPLNAKLAAQPLNIDSKNEPFIGGNCPYCGDLIKANSKIIICSDCETPHHQECWEKHGGCTTFGCKSMPETQK